jgi:hypothetical protein
LDAGKLFGSATLGALTVTDGQAVLLGGAAIDGLETSGSINALTPGTDPTFTGIPAGSGVSANFNSDRLDDYHASDLLALANATGILATSKGGTGADGSALASRLVLVSPAGGGAAAFRALETGDISDFAAAVAATPPQAHALNSALHTGTLTKAQQNSQTVYLDVVNIFSNDIVAPLVRRATADGSDNSQLEMCGGGAALSSRGARFQLYGNEHATFPGYVRIQTGGVAAGQFVVYTGTGGADRLTIDGSGNIVPGTAALATTAVNGFTYIQTCPGTPTGVPTAFAGRAALVYDTTNNKLYVYNGAWKATAALT